VLVFHWQTTTVGIIEGTVMAITSIKFTTITIIMRRPDRFTLSATIARF
jgi:hypothetical protein